MKAATGMPDRRPSGGIRPRVAACILLPLFFAFLAGCSGRPDEKDLLRAWVMDEARAHYVMIFSTGGKLTIKAWIDGVRRAPVEGVWRMDGGGLTLMPERAVEGLAWTENAPALLPDVRLKFGKLTLEETVWQAFESTGKTVKTTVGPLIVNLATDPVLEEKERFLCLFADITANDPHTPETVHPRAVEAIQSFLASLSYSAVIRDGGAQAMRAGVFSALLPYYGGTLSSVDLRRIMVTSDPRKLAAYRLLKTPDDPAK